ncbi:glycosyltransferase family 2 [Colletotrichum salicis]|uniref:Glycosyltransferase family 2 n=1 Tax=Colletotrichum salicis TaxID=1209931 RepID=A0A135TCG6_9PEZI|nr:glycosyltransferase family 2 [Colletotrichum salicis]
MSPLAKLAPEDSRARTTRGEGAMLHLWIQLYAFPSSTLTRSTAESHLRNIWTSSSSYRREKKSTGHAAAISEREPLSPASSPAVMTENYIRGALRDAWNGICTSEQREVATTKLVQALNHTVKAWECLAMGLLALDLAITLYGLSAKISDAVIPIPNEVAIIAFTELMVLIQLMQILLPVYPAEEFEMFAIPQQLREKSVCKWVSGVFGLQETEFPARRDEMSGNNLKAFGVFLIPIAAAVDAGFTLKSVLEAQSYPKSFTHFNNIRLNSSDLTLSIKKSARKLSSHFGTGIPQETSRQKGNPEYLICALTCHLALSKEFHLQLPFTESLPTHLIHLVNSVNTHKSPSLTTAFFLSIKPRLLSSPPKVSSSHKQPHHSFATKDLLPAQFFFHHTINPLHTPILNQHTTKILRMSSYVLGVLWAWNAYDEVLTKKLMNKAKPIPLPRKPSFKSTDVSIIVPTINTPDTFTDCLRLWLANKPKEIIIVTIERDLQRVHDLVKPVIIEGEDRISVMTADYASKRDQMVVGMKEAKGKILALVDDDAFWSTLETLPYLLAPFEDPKVGGVTGKQSARISADRRVPAVITPWEVASLRSLDNQNNVQAVRSAADGGCWCMVGRTMMVRTDIAQDPRFMEAITNDRWNGQLMNTGDDVFLTRWLMSENWDIAVQNAPQAEITTLVMRDSDLLYQMIRWQRNAIHYFVAGYYIWGWFRTYNAFARRFPYVSRQIWACFLLDNAHPILDVYAWLTISTEAWGTRDT